MSQPAGVVTLGAAAARLPVLEVSCNRYERRKRLRTDRLLMVPSVTP
jgi:hypothetical protein